MSSASLLNSTAACTAFWLLIEHGPGLNVTGISELCTQHNANLWEGDSTPSSGNASIDSDVEKSQRGKVELYYYCTANQPTTDAAAAAQLTWKRCTEKWPSASV